VKEFAKRLDCVKDIASQWEQQKGSAT